MLPSPQEDKLLGKIQIQSNHVMFVNECLILYVADDVILHFSV